MNNGPVFIIDDDPEELEIVKEIWKDVGRGHGIEVFTDPHSLIARLREKINPFLIICDVNLGKMDGFELRKRLCDEQALSYKSIPFVFWSTSASNEQIKRSYDMGGHGFFIKGTTYLEIKESLNLIMKYWTVSKAPELPKNFSAIESMSHR